MITRGRQYSRDGEIALMAVPSGNLQYRMWHRQKADCKCHDCPRVGGYPWSRGGFYQANGPDEEQFELVDAGEIPAEILAEIAAKY